MCLTCRLIQQAIMPPGGIIHQSASTILHHCLDVNIPGYLILSPLRHVAGYQELTEPELTGLHQVLHRSTGVLQQLPLIDRVYICSLGEETSHFHFHIFPRYRWMLDDPSGLIFTNGKVDGAKLFSLMRSKHKVADPAILSAEIAATADYLRNCLAIPDNSV